MIYVGFWRRFAASVVDGLVLLPLTLFVHYKLREGVVPTAHGYSAILRPWDVAYFFVFWLYCAGMEASPLQATVGKRAQGIVVTDELGNRLGFAHATGRHFAKILSVVTLGIGYLMAGFMPRKQGLHDRVARTLVVQRDSVELEPPRGTLRVSSLVVFLAVSLVFAGLAYGTRNAGRLPRADVYLVGLGEFSGPELDRVAAAYEARGVRAVTLPNIPLSRGDVNQGRRQLILERVQDELAAAYGPGVRHGSALVGVTAYDMYAESQPGGYFVLAAPGEHHSAVISTARMSDSTVDVARSRMDKAIALEAQLLRAGRSAPAVVSTAELDRLPEPFGGSAPLSSAR